MKRAACAHAQRCGATIVTLLTLASIAQARTISIVSGSYGQNCSAAAGNVTRDLAARCNGRATCAYALNQALARNVASSCPRALLVRWRCTPAPAARWC